MKFGTDGVRGVANSELTPDFAVRLGRAAAQELAEGLEPRVVYLGADTRESSPMLASAFAAGAMSAHCDVVDLGVAPTPMVAYHCQRSGAFGAMISASHNPYHDNGIKLFAPGGSKLSDAVQHRIEDRLAETAASEAPDASGDDALAVGSVTTIGPEARHAYAEHLLSALDGRRLGGLHIVVDCANGAAREAPDVLAEAGATVTAIANDPDGRNINDGCGATQPELLAAAVRDVGADLGIALDGDADRLIAVDHLGRVVDGDHIIAICAEDLRSRGLLARDTVVVTVMTNLGFRLAMERAGITVVETGVGDRYVLEALAEGGYSLGGEQSGHVIFADHSVTGDGLLTGLVLADVVVRSGSTLAGLADGAMTALPQVLINVEVGQRVSDAAERLGDVIAVAESELGLAGRVLVRGSGTEPLVRVMVEAASDETAYDIADRIAVVARQRFA